MPRPRLLPSQRQRAAEACKFCRDSKKRCSGTAPCSHCLRRGIGGECYITPRPRRSRPVRVPSDATILPNPSFLETEIFDSALMESVVSPETENRGQQLRSRGKQRAIPIANPEIEVRMNVNGSNIEERHACPLSPSASYPDTSGQGIADEDIQRRASDASISAKPHSRMLLNQRGERLYIGGAASLSFLQLVRAMVSEQIGPSQFSHNDKRDTMLEKESPNSSRSMAAIDCVGLDTNQRMSLTQAYRAVTEGFIDVFGPCEMDGYVLGMREARQNGYSQRRALMELAIAIGAQATSAELAREVGQSYFRRAQAQAFKGMLEDPDIDMVRSFLLMAFYMLGECRRNSAFMYLGVATRAAVALGLHSRESYTDMNDDEDELRLRVWLSLRVVDMLVNSILGRPAATAGLNSDVNDIISDIPCERRGNDLKTLIASHQIVCIINGIVDKLYDKKEISTPVVEQLLGDIEAWVEELPDSLRSSSAGPEDSNTEAQRRNIESIHISCLYYFAVTLVSRPILIATLMAPPTTEEHVQSQVAAACLDAAVYLIQTCVDARKANLLYGNMCIMKALVFAAGLVLGFEIFAKRSVDYGIESAFQGGKDILNFFATQSPQAAHYFEILTLLSNSISKQREKLASKGRSRYVSKIFTLRQPKDGSGIGSGYEQQEFAASSSVLPTSSLLDGMTWSSRDQTPAETTSELFSGWDSLDISQWDSFPFVS